MYKRPPYLAQLRRRPREVLTVVPERRILPVIPEPEPFYVWAVYDHPDYPNEYIARKWCNKGAENTLTDDMLRFATLDAVRNTMRMLGLSRIRRAPDDNPTIIETWV